MEGGPSFSGKDALNQSYQNSNMESEGKGSSPKQVSDDTNRNLKARRSKKDKEGRSFKCDKCDKTYLSYPALYTHTKIKHSEGADGKPILPVFSGRGRGRPRKNANKVDPTSDEFFQTLERAGQTENLLEGYKEMLYEVYETEDVNRFPLTKYLVHFQDVLDGRR